MGIHYRKIPELILLSFRNDHSFILKNKMEASDHRLLAVDLRSDAVGNDILCLCMHFLVRKAFFFCSNHYRPCHGMWEMFLQAGCLSQKFILGFAVKGDNLHQFRTGLRECSRLIEYDGICFCHCLQETPALHRDVIVCRLPDRRQNRNGHGHFERTGIIHHQDRNCLGDISADETGECGG